MPRKQDPNKPKLVFVCSWQSLRSAMSAMLKPHGLKLVVQKTYDGDTRDDDCRYLSVVKDVPT